MQGDTARRRLASALHVIRQQFVLHRIGMIPSPSCNRILRAASCARETRTSTSRQPYAVPSPRDDAARIGIPARALHDGRLHACARCAHTVPNGFRHDFTMVLRRCPWGHWEPVPIERVLRFTRLGDSKASVAPTLDDADTAYESLRFVGVRSWLGRMRVFHAV